MQHAFRAWERLYQSFDARILTVLRASLDRVEVPGYCCADDGWETVGKKSKGSAKIDGQNHNSAFIGEYHPKAATQAGARTATAAPSAQPAAAAPAPCLPCLPPPQPPAPRHVPTLDVPDNYQYSQLSHVLAKLL